MSGLLLPTDFESGNRLEQITYLLDLSVRLHPCYGPTAKCTSPGKQPRWKEEGRLSASRLEILNHFKRYPDDNIGLIPVGGHVVLDPDLNKKLKESGNLQPLEDWKLLFTRLFEWLHALSWRGFHHHLFLSEIPADQGKISIPNYLPGLSLEIFIGPKCNIIIPPSIHPSGHVYRWGGSQEAELSYKQMLGRLRVDPNTPSQERQSHDDGAWKERFKGDLRTLAADTLCKALGIYGQILENKDRPAFTIRCPWGAQHGDPEREERWSGSDSGTVLFWGENRIPVFNCQHANTCSNHTIKHFLLWCEEQEPGIVDRHCRWFYRPRIDQAEQSDLSDQSEESPNHVREPWPPVTTRPEEFRQQIFYPENSILHPFIEYGRSQTEGSDAYLLGSILAVCASLIGRRVSIDFGGPLYLNLFNLIVGRPGDRKSFTIKLATRIARLLLNAERFLPPLLSVEGLFDEYCPDEGGDPDQLCIVDDAAIVLSTWRSSTYGERVADLMLRLYDCEALSEAFRRNKKNKKERRVKRSIPETSTTLLFGATFADALFPKQKSQQGLARRFLYYLACATERFIPWPKQESFMPVAELFKPLLRFTGVLSLDKHAEQLWENFQRNNRIRGDEVSEHRPDQAYAFSSEPTHVLKIAALFELVTAAAHSMTSKRTIGYDSLALAINHVAENLKASEYLFHRAQRLEAAQQGEEILANIRVKFPPSRRYPDTIFANRSALTYTFCRNVERRNAITVDDLYLRIIPELILQGQAQQVLKKSRLELYAFRASDDDEPSPISVPPLGSEEPISPISPNSTPPCTHVSSYTYADTFLGDIYIKRDVPVEFVEVGEFAPPAPRDVDLSSNILALDLETCAEPKIARRGAPKITASRDALNPWKGEIRLLTLADEDGNIRSFDLRDAPLSDEIRAAVERSTLIIHNACFDLLFLKCDSGSCRRKSSVP
jgi:hypothetical protein